MSSATHTAAAIVPISHGTAIAALLENCELIRFEECGHFIHWEEPEGLASALRFFLDSPNAPPAHPRSRPLPSSVATMRDIPERLRTVSSGSSMTAPVSDGGPLRLPGGG